MLMKPLSLLSLVLLSTSSYAVPLNRRDLPTLKVVTNEAGNEVACTPAQVNTLKKALEEGASLATKAATALSQPGAEKTDAAEKWLGTITPAKLATQVTKRLTNVAAAFTSTLTEVDEPEEDDAVYFFCPDKDDPDNDPCDDTSDAVTTNKLTGSNENTIALCGRFFDGKTLDDDKAEYQKGFKAEDTKKIDFLSPRSKGVILVHEAQHSLPVLQSTTKSDNLKDDASTPRQAASLTNSNQKQKNAENWALLAYLAEVDPDRLACGTGGGSTDKRAVSSSKGGAVCPLRSSGNSSSSSDTKSVPTTSTSSVTAKPTRVPAKTKTTPTTSTSSVAAKSTKVPAKSPTAPTKPAKSSKVPAKAGRALS